MVQHGHLDVPVIGVARAGRTNEHLKERVRDSIQQQGGDIDQEALAKILKLLRYVGGDYEKPETFDLLKMFALSMETTTCTLVQIVRRTRPLSDKKPMKLITSDRSTPQIGFSRHDWRKYSRAVLYWLYVFGLWCWRVSSRNSRQASDKVIPIRFCSPTISIPSTWFLRT